MSVKQIFIEKLKQSGYKQNKNVPAVDLEDPDFNKVLESLEKDRENVFKAMYGTKNIKNRGKRVIKEYMYRLLEAEHDLKLGYIRQSMHYLLIQIKIKSIKL